MYLFASLHEWVTGKNGGSQILGFVEPPTKLSESLRVGCQLAKPSLEVTSSTFEGSCTLMLMLVAKTTEISSVLPRILLKQLKYRCLYATPIL